MGYYVYLIKSQKRCGHQMNDVDYHYLFCSINQGDYRSPLNLNFCKIYCMGFISGFSIKVINSPTEFE